VLRIWEVRMAGLKSRSGAVKPRWSPEAARSLTLAQVRKWPPTVSVESAAAALGTSRATLYAAIAEGASPVAYVKVRRTIKVLTADLLRVLEGRTAA
jgi:hypothetical protein